MRLRDIGPYIGRRCQMMVQCRACGGTHVHEGTLDVARRPGEVQLDGYCFLLSEIRALVAAPLSEGDELRTVNLPRADLLWRALLLLAALSALRALVS